MNKAFFIDRDGVLIEDANYLSKPEQVRFIPGAVKALKLIREKGFLIVVLSNQSGIARGYFTFDDLQKVQDHMEKLLSGDGAKVDKWYYCPHHVKGIVKEFAIDCDCRKPKPGLLLQAARELDIDIAASAMIGDKLSDVQCGINAGTKFLARVTTGHGSEEAESVKTDGVIEAESLLPAVEALLTKMDV